MNTKFAAILIFCLFSFSISAGENESDSLKRLLRNAQSDSGKANLYNLLAKSYLRDSLQLVKQYADSAYKISQQNNYQKGKADALLYRGEFHYYSSQYEKAIANYLKAAENYMAYGDTVKTSLMYYYAGYAKNELSRYEEAAALFKKSIHLDSLLADTSGLAENLNSLGMAYEYLGKYKEAAEIYLTALNYARISNDSTIISGCYINLGNIYSTWGNYEKALDYYLQALKIEETLNDPSGLAVIYNNIGIIYHDWKEYDKALKYYEKGYRIEKQTHNKSGLAKSINNIAIIQEEKKNYDTALMLYHKSLQIEKEVGNKLGVAVSYGNIGEFYSEHQNNDTANAYYQEALELYNEIQNPSGIGHTYNQLGSIRFQEGNYEEAVNYYHKSLAIVDTLGLTEMIVENYKDLSEAYNKAGNLPMAFEYLSRLQKLKDSIFNREIRDKLTSMQYDYDLQKKQDEIELLNKEQALQKLKIEQQSKANDFLSLISIITSAGLLVIAVITLLLIRQYRQKAEANAELRRQRDELEKKGHDLRLAKEHAEESDRLKTAFLANLSHEVRTPMNGILGFADLLREENPPARERKMYLDVITDNGHQLINILNDLLDISLIETGQVNIKKQYVELESLVRELYVTHAEINKKSNKGKVELIYQKDHNSKGTEILTDRYRLKQILNNLISNAIKYTETGYIRIGYLVADNKIAFSVEDSGIGISREHQQIIFDRFRQVDESNTRKRGGTGLGLTISKKLAEMLGGDIYVQSEINKGSKFTFKLPCRIKHAKAVPQYHKSSPKRNILLPELTNKCILVAEDDEASYNLLSRILKNTHCQIMHVRNGKECVQAYTNNKNIDMVLMDLQMPEMNGMEAARIIKQLSPSASIVAVTAYSHLKQDDPEIEGLFLDYLMKPVSSRQLLSVINSVLKQN